MSAILDREVLEATERAVSVYGLCPHRVWSVARNHPDNERALPQLFPPNDGVLEDLFSTASARDDTAHRGCTFDFCEQSQLNFTSVTQRHESPSCRVRPCTRIKGLFPAAELNKAAEDDAATAWQLSGQKVVFPSQSYLAISHVWSDGTGAGTWPTGEVNTCLFHFFAYIARWYKCNGIWWDAICIPTDRTARAKAIVNMHTNYSSAKLTLVHDCFLREVTFEDPETACIAILMSPWFSRGWTAVELANSPSVVVAFKGSPAHPRLIDLDKITEKPRTARHRVAADTICALRNGTIFNLDRLLRILGSRYTSWVKDMPIISALLVGAEVKPHQAAQDKETVTNIFQQDIYRSVITKIHRLGHGHLFHNLPTVLNGISWCPARLLDLPSSFTERSLTVDMDGNLTGLWLVVPVNSIPVDSVSFHDAHPIVKAKIRLSLQDHEHHRFLFEPSDGNLNRAVLARSIQLKLADDCYQFIGSVFLRPPCILAKVSEPQNIMISYGNRPGGAGPIEIAKPDSNPEQSGQSAGASGTGEIDTDQLTNFASPEQASLEDAHEPLFTALNKVFNLQRPVIMVNELLPPYTDDIEHAFLLNPSNKTTESDQRAALIQMAKIGDERGLVGQMQFERGKSNPFMCDEGGRTALSWAAGQGHTAIVDRLLESFRFHAIPENKLEDPKYRDSLLSPVNFQSGVFRSYCNQMDEDGRTPLAWAAAEGRLDTVMALLRYPDVVVDARDQLRWTPLWYAANNSRVDVMQYLIGAGADKSLKDLSGLSMTERVAAEGTVDAMKVLLRPPLATNTIGFALTEASYKGRLHMIQLLIKAGAPVDMENNWGTRPIRAAVSQGHNKVVRLLIDTGNLDLRANTSDPRKMDGFKTYSLLCLAINHKNDTFGDPGDTTRNIGGFLDIIKMLIDTRQMDIQPALHLAASLGDNVVVELLLQTGEVDVNARDPTYGDASAIYYAAARGHIRVVEQLLQTEVVDINIPGTFAVPGKYTSKRGEVQRETPLQAAIANEHRDVVNVLRDYAKRRKQMPFRKWFGSP